MRFCSVTVGTPTPTPFPTTSKASPSPSSPEAVNPGTPPLPRSSSGPQTASWSEIGNSTAEPQTTTSCGRRPLAGLSRDSVLTRCLKWKELTQKGKFTYIQIIGSQRGHSNGDQSMPELGSCTGRLDKSSGRSCRITACRACRRNRSELDSSKSDGGSGSPEVVVFKLWSLFVGFASPPAG